MTHIFTNNKKNQFPVFFSFFFIYFLDINALDKNILYEFKYIFPRYCAINICVVFKVP